MRRHFPFLALLLVVAVARFLILLTSQTHVHSDEAIIGLMGKHIMEGLVHPFYMYGQVYNACAAWEAYWAAILFAIFGVGVIQLKSGMVILSLVTFILFYRMVSQLYDRTTAWWSCLALALMPSLLKWDFQVRGYSFYFMAIPVLTWLFFEIESGRALRPGKFFIFGLVSGLSIWGLELIVTLAAAFWVLLALRRSLSIKNLSAGLGGLILGYSPAIIYNLTHHFDDWRVVFLEKGGLSAGLFKFSTLAHILFIELPKFFGPDTVLWYYPEIPLVGVIFYGIVVAAVTVMLLPFAKAPARIIHTLGPRAVKDDEHKDVLVLILAAACFVPYLTAPIRVPGYFLGGCFFFAILIGRLICRCFASSTAMKRGAGMMVAAAVLTGGIAAAIQTVCHNQIETLGVNRTAQSFQMERIPGADLDTVERYLAQKKISATWATVSLVYPLIFETNEKLAVSGAIFNFNPQVYPSTVPRQVPNPALCKVFVVESDSPLLPRVEAWCEKFGGGAPVVTPCGVLTVIEATPPEAKGD